MLTPEIIAARLSDTFPFTTIEPFAHGVKIRLDGLFNGWMFVAPRPCNIEQYKTEGYEVTT